MATKTMNREKVAKVVGLSFFAIAILLAFIGCFGDIFKQTATLSEGFISESYSESISFTWLFKGMWDLVKSVKDTPVHGVTLVFSILSLASYIICLGTIISVAIKTLMDFVKNKDVIGIDYHKGAKYLVSSIAAFIAIFMAYQYLGVRASIPGASESAESGLGWGTILMMIGAIISVIASGLSNVKNNMGKNDIIALVLNKVGLMLLLFIAIYGFRATAQVNITLQQEGYVLQGKEFLGIWWLYFACKVGGIDAAKGLVIFSLILIAFMIALVTTAINAKSDKNKVACFGLILVLSVVVGILTNSAVGKLLGEGAEQVGMKSAFGEANIVNIMLTAVGLILTCVSMKLAPTQEVKKVAAPKE